MADVSGTVSVRYSYPVIQYVTSASNEFFYEGFEENVLGVTGTPFAGKRYYYGAYTVPFVIPNARSYQIDYHYLLNGQWYAVTKPYQNNMVLNDGSGVDEVRVYPVDAQISTYTYDPLIGLTSEADARNRFTFYEYDNFGRLKYIRDNDRNIIKRYDYVYQTSLAQTCPRPVITSITNDGLSITASYIAPTGCTGISYTLKENWSGNTTTATAGRVGVPITMNISSRNQSYTVTITSYSADCPSGVSTTQIVTVPQ
jgi:YD repeat-containing protein